MWQKSGLCKVKMDKAHNVECTNMTLRFNVFKEKKKKQKTKASNVT